MSTLSARRPLLVVAVLAMIATMLFAINATTASAAAPVPSKTAEFTACPDNAGIPTNGFSDTAGSLYNDAANCLSYYGVAKGTSAGIYSPNNDVSRAQMALFLQRLAHSAGVSLNAAAPAAGFTDIGGLSQETQNAINQLAAAGIVKGTTATTFGPTNPVLRSQMALFLTRFLSAAHISEGSYGPGSAIHFGAPFTDINGVSAEASVAINQAWDLGLTTGNTATTYDPSGHVTRGQMALFLTRTASQANTRPAGVNIQGVAVEGFGAYNLDIAVTVRDATFAPVPNVDVDQFSTKTASPFWTAPWWAVGSCDLSKVTAFAGAIDPCTLNVGDPTVDLWGNMPLANAVPFSGATTAAYAWTGPNGMKFNIHSTPYSMITILSHEPATQAKVSTSIPATALTWDELSPAAPGKFARFNQPVTVTVQLLDVSGAPVPQAGIRFNANVCHQGGDTWGLFVLPWGTAECQWQMITTDATGAATFQTIQYDPNPGTYGDEANTLVHIWKTGDTTFAPVEEWTAINWRDVSTEQSVKATSAVGSIGHIGGPNPLIMENTLTATVYDMFGDPVVGERVFFESDNNVAGLGWGIGPNAAGPYAFGRPGTPELTPLGAGDHEGATNLSEWNGQTTVTYNWEGAISGVENFEIWTATTRIGEEGTPSVSWTNDAVSGDVPTVPAAAVLVAIDMDAKAFVVAVSAGVYRTFYWDAGDLFEISGVAATQAQFETAMDAVTFPTASTITMGAGDYNPGGVSTFNFTP